MFRLLTVLWAILGVTLLLGYAIFRLSHHAVELLHYSLNMKEMVALVASMLFMAYSEGYKGFQKGFSPRVAARVKYIKEHGNWRIGMLAPIFCMGFFGTTKRRQISVIILTLGLFLLIAIVRTLPQPWRGIIDAGVVIGLTWGLLSFYYYVYRALTDPDYPYSPELN